MSCGAALFDRKYGFGKSKCYNPRACVDLFFA